MNSGVVILISLKIFMVDGSVTDLYLI
jgi:hypothetical protein